MIYYFTGTGNSLWAAKRMFAELNEPIESIVKYKNVPEICCNDHMAGFIFPTYMGDLPWIAKEFLLKLKLKSDCYTFVIMTSSNGTSGNSFRSLDQALSRSGVVLSAGFDLQMPGNCLKSSEKENSRRLDLAPSHMEQIIQVVKERKINYTSDKSRPAADYVTGSYFYGEHSLKRLTLMKNFTVTKDCNGCGVCISVCPMHNIRIISQKAVHGHECAACYACLHWCPQNATLLNVPTLKHRPQYHHPEISLKDLDVKTE